MIPEDKRHINVEVTGVPMDGRSCESEYNSIRLGSDSYDSFVLDLDPDIEEKHLVIFSTFDCKWYLWNRSEKPVTLNDQSLEVAAEICPGAKIRVGQTELLVSELSPLFEPAAEETEETMEENGEGWICGAEGCGHKNEPGATWCRGCGRPRKDGRAKKEIDLTEEERNRQIEEEMARAEREGPSLEEAEAPVEEEPQEQSEEVSEQEPEEEPESEPEEEPEGEPIEEPEPEREDTKSCPFCGEDNRITARFCDGCGRSLEEELEEPEEQEEPIREEEGPVVDLSTKLSAYARRNWPATIIYLVISLALLGGGYALTLISRWFWFLAVPMMFFAGIFFYGLATKYVVCPHCNEVMPIMSSGKVVPCIKCHREFLVMKSK
jgi:hypothetical protein